MFDKVILALEDVGEGALGYEYQILIGQTASVGEHDWAAILTDPSIPVSYKQDLVLDIHCTALIAASSASEQ